MHHGHIMDPFRTGFLDTKYLVANAVEAIVHHHVVSWIGLSHEKIILFFIRRHVNLGDAWYFLYSTLICILPKLCEYLTFMKKLRVNTFVLGILNQPIYCIC